MRDIPARDNNLGICMLHVLLAWGGIQGSSLRTEVLGLVMGAVVLSRGTTGVVFKKLRGDDNISVCNSTALLGVFSSEELEILLLAQDCWGEKLSCHGEELVYQEEELGS
eukprot:11493444-Ditylum_brightwellii.AAC.1